MTKENKKNTIKEIDANGKTLGRISSEIAVNLLGKNKPSFERHIFSGTPVKVINASKIKITIKKLNEIVHKRYSGRPGGLKIIKAIKVSKDKGYSELIRHAVYQMLPGNKLRRDMMKKLTIEE